MQMIWKREYKCIKYYLKKYPEMNSFYVGHLLSNIQFYIERVINDKEFIKLFQEYVDF